jgi:hypothetical protein
MESFIVTNTIKSDIINNKLTVSNKVLKENRLDYIIHSSMIGQFNGLCSYLSLDSWDINHKLTFDKHMVRDQHRIVDDMLKLSETTTEPMRLYRVTKRMAIDHCETNIKPCNIQNYFRNYNNYAVKSFLSTTTSWESMKRIRGDDDPTIWFHIIDIPVNTKIIDVDKHSRSLCEKYPYLIENSSIFDQKEIILIPPIMLQPIEYLKNDRILIWRTI